MKKLLGILVLILFTLQTPSQADDIRDFQIEGMSLGDSLLDYISKELIIREKNKTSPYVSKDFFIAEFESKSLKTLNTNTYTSFQAHVKKNDDSYKIHSLSGMISFQGKSFNECKKRKKEVSNELSEIFESAERKEGKVQDAAFDKTGDSKTISTYFFLSNGVVRVICYDTSKALEDKFNWIDSLDIVIYTREFGNWLNNKAYK